MHGSDLRKILTALGHAATLRECGAVDVLTEGHLFRWTRPSASALSGSTDPIEAGGGYASRLGSS
jgi:hypothetical protein